MNANEKIYVKSYIAYTTEDVFLDGDTIEDAIKAVCDANVFDYVPSNCQNVGKDWPDEAGRFDISFMVDVNNSEATKYDIEEWKAGRKRLWSCQISVYLGVCAERDLTPEEVAA